MSGGHGYGEGQGAQSRTIWDLKPDGGGNPVTVVLPVIDAQERVSRDPKRYAYYTPGELAPWRGVQPAKLEGPRS